MYYLIARNAAGSIQLGQPGSLGALVRLARRCNRRWGAQCAILRWDGTMVLHERAKRLPLPA